MYTDLNSRFTPDVLDPLAYALAQADSADLLAAAPLLRVSEGIPQTSISSLARAAVTSAFERSGRHLLLEDARRLIADRPRTGDPMRSLAEPKNSASHQDAFPPYLDTVDGYYVKPNSTFLNLLRKAPSSFWSGARVADLGAGTGRHAISAGLIGATVDAVEISRHGCSFMEQQSQQLGMRNLNPIHASIVDFNLGACKYDLIIAATVLEHVSRSERGQIARRMVASVKPGGFILVKVFLDDDPGASIGEERSSETAGFVADYFRAGELLQLFTASGVDTVSYREYAWEDLSHGAPHFHSAAEIIVRGT